MKSYPVNHPLTERYNVSMQSAGYSHRTLTQKLGLKSGDRAHFINPPEGFLDQLDVTNVEIISVISPGMSFIHAFLTARASLEVLFPEMKQNLTSSGMLWISWPKRAARMETDLTENVVRDIGLCTGLVDVKVAAIDTTWSGLKFVRRLADR